jgi:hypothetical protein
LVQALRNHAPISAAPGAQIDSDGEEYRIDGVTSHGLGFACINRQLAVSMPSHRWMHNAIQLTHLWLDGSGEVDSDTVMVRHAARPSHIDDHAQFIRELALPVGFTSTEVWDDRKQLFADLRFLPSVGAEIGALTGGAFEQVMARLVELQDVAADWTALSASGDQWLSLIRSKVSTESASRKRYCMFADLDGVSRCFDWHIRYTPYEGRIHFRLPMAGSDHFVVAYIGKKRYPAKS